MSCTSSSCDASTADPGVAGLALGVLAPLPPLPRLPDLETLRTYAAIFVASSPSFSRSAASGKALTLDSNCFSLLLITIFSNCVAATCKPVLSLTFTKNRACLRKSLRNSLIASEKSGRRTKSEGPGVRGRASAAERAPGCDRLCSVSFSLSNSCN